MRYKLLKDLPWAKAGTIWEQMPREGWAHQVHTQRDYSKAVLCKYLSDPEWFSPINERYKPEDGEPYWYVGDDGVVCQETYTNRHYGIHRYMRGNCFRSEPTAIEAAKRIKEALLTYHEELENE